MPLGLESVWGGWGRWGSFQKVCGRQALQHTLSLFFDYFSEFAPLPHPALNTRVFAGDLTQFLGGAQFLKVHLLHLPPPRQTERRPPHEGDGRPEGFAVSSASRRLAVVAVRRMAWFWCAEARPAESSAVHWSAG
jgi:hypothetical protein